MNAQINTVGNNPTTSDDEDEDESEIGFGYGLLSTGPSNMIVATTDLGLKKEEVTVVKPRLATEEILGEGEPDVVSSNGLELHFLEMTPIYYWATNLIIVISNH